MVGVLACGHFAAASLPSDDKSVVTRLGPVFVGTCIVTLIVHIASFWLAVASMADVPLSQAFGMMGSSTATTQMGHMWLVGSVALGLLAGASLIRVLDRWRHIFTWPFIVALILSRSSASHAASADNATIAIVIDAAHFFATSLWMGSVAIAAFVLMPRLIHKGDGQRSSSFLSTAVLLSHTATAALAAVVLTGVYKTWSNLGPPTPFAFTSYVNILCVKLALVFLAIALGAGNRFFVMPVLDNSRGTADSDVNRAQRSFIHILRIESGVLLLVLIVASLLSFTSPT